MLGYVTLGTSDLRRAATFYDAIAAELGAGRIMDNDQFIAWGPSDGGPGLSVSRAECGNRVTAGNGVVVGLIAIDRAQVDRVHALALQLGGTDAGAPAERFTGLYAAEFCDLDGHRLNAFAMG